MMHGFISLPNSRSSLRDLWNARYLVVQLIVRDLSVRYRHTLLGWLWAVLNPILNLGMYYVVFGIMIRVNPPEYKISYTWVLLSGLVLWMLFASTMNAVSDSLMNNLHLIKKVYFPRITLAVSAIASSVMDFFLSLLLMSMALFIIGCKASLMSVTLTFLCGVIASLCGWGLGCILAILRLRFRDLRHVIPLVVQGFFYLTPVVWTSGMISPSAANLLMLNPLNGVLALFRYALLNGPEPGLNALVISFTGCLVLIILGYFSFVRFEAQVADRE